MSVINEKSLVTMHFSLKLTDGSVADGTRANDKPGVVQMGDGTLTEGFEQAILGLAANDKKSFTLTPDQAFGEVKESLIYELPRHKFEHADHLSEGLIMEFGLPNGGLIPGVIRKVDDEMITVDCNHLLAGQTLQVDVEIINVNNN